MEVPILKTRLYKPQLNGKLVERHQLIKKLDEGKDKTLSLVVAPTGYGKSVVVSQWLDKSDTKNCWITLDDEVDELTTFVSYLTHGLRSQFTEAFAGIQKLLEESEVSSLDTISNLLINELDEINEDFIIVLDDYHCIKNQKINGLINNILKYPPERLHLVIISRWDPALLLSTHRTFGLINDLRGSDLNFTLDEVKEFANGILQESLSDDDCEILLKKTEGWAVGVKLTVCDLNNCDNAQKSVRQLNINQQYFREYILDELFQRQSDKVKQMLVSSVVGPRFCKELLQTILEPTDSESSGFDDETYENIVRKWQFIVPLDNHGEWFRFHHIIHDFLALQLKKSLSTKEIERLHKKASLYFEKQGQFDSAIKLAVKAEDVDLISGIVERNKYQILNNEKLGRLHKWIEIIPGEWVEQSAELLLVRIMLFSDVNNYEAMQKDLILVEQILQNLNDDHPNLTRQWGEYYTYRANFAFVRGELDETIESSRKAIRLLKNYPGFIRNVALYYASLALQTKGQAFKAYQLIDQNLKNTSNSDFRGITHSLFTQAVVSVMEGDFRNLLSTIGKIKDLSQKHGLHASYVSANHLLFGLYYRQNELSSALALLDDFDDYIYSGWPVLVMNYLFLKGFALNANGDLLGYHNTLQQIQEFAGSLEKEDMFPVIKAFEVEMAMMHGDYDKAKELSEVADFDPYPPYGYYYIPQLTRVKLLIYSGDIEKQETALEELNQLVDLGFSRHSYNLLSKALPLRALLLNMLGKSEMAQFSLDEALSICRSRGYIRNFLDLGEVMHSMIKDHLRKKPKDAYLIKIEKAFHPEQEIYHKFEMIKKNGVAKVNPHVKLSKRESEIISLLTKGYQNKEIAGELFISNEAVKKSLYRLYQKLDVKNRSTAIMHAVDLGLVATSA